MPLATALLTRQRVLEAKTESSSGTPESLTTANGVFNIFDAKVEPTIPATEREGQASLSPLAPVPGRGSEIAQVSRAGRSRRKPSPTYRG